MALALLSYKVDSILSIMLLVNNDRSLMVNVLILSCEFISALKEEIREIFCC